MRLSRKDANKIVAQLERDGGTIGSEGYIKVETAWTWELREWIGWGAEVFFSEGRLCIGNWPEPKPEPLPPGEYTCKVTTTQAVNDTRAEGFVAAVITEGEYKGRSIPIKLQSEDC